MDRVMMKSKIHRATVTDANLNYEGSISIDDELLEAANIVPYEQVHIYNISNGNRFTTYAIRAPKGSGSICLNGAAARMVSKEDLIIIATYANVSDRECKDFHPVCVYVDSENKIKNISK